MPTRWSTVQDPRLQSALLYLRAADAFERSAQLADRLASDGTPRQATVPDLRARVERARTAARRCQALAVTYAEAYLDGRELRP